MIILPAYHPSYAAFRDPKFEEQTILDLGKALAFAKGERTPTAWPILIRPTFRQACAFLRSALRTPGRVAFDTETDGAPPSMARVRCYSLATAKLGGICIPIIHTPAMKPYWTAAQWGAIQELTAKLLGSPRHTIVGQNRKYDDQVAQHIFGVLPSPGPDSMYLHQAVRPDLPHRLGFLTSAYTDAPYHKDLAKESAKDDRKGAVKFWKIPSDEADGDFMRYSAMDSACLVVPDGQDRRSLIDRLEAQVIEEKVTGIPPRGLALANIARGMEQRGIAVDLDVRREYRRYLVGRKRELLNRMRVICGDEHFHPCRKAAVAKVLFDQFGVPVVSTTEKNQVPAVTKEVLGFIAASPGLPKEQRDFVRWLRAFDNSSTILATHVVGLPIQANGCVHPSWSAGMKVTERWGCKDPNMMNILKHRQPRKTRAGKQDVRFRHVNLREMFQVHKSDNILLWADVNQLELLVCACLAGEQTILDLWRRGVDLHCAITGALWPALTALLIREGHLVNGDPLASDVEAATILARGISPLELVEKPYWYALSGLIKRCPERDLEKRYIYQWQYGGTPRGIYDKLRAEGVPIDLETCFHLHHALRRCFPAIPAWHGTLEADFLAQRAAGQWPVYRSTVSGRLRYFCGEWGGDDEAESSKSMRSEYFNFPVQEGGAKLVNDWMLACDPEVPSTGTEGWVLQVHDELVVEVPRRDVRVHAALLRDRMTETSMKVYGIPFGIEMGCGSHWTVNECVCSHPMHVGESCEVTVGPRGRTCRCRHAEALVM